MVLCARSLHSSTFVGFEIKYQPTNKINIIMSTQTPQSIIERLFSVGGHFGFKKSRRHPTVVPYIFTTKDGNDIIDLEKTGDLIAKASSALTDLAQNGKTIVLVSTKDETSRLVREQALRAELSYVSNRWIGGMLTNFGEIKKRLARLESLEHEKVNGELERKYTKKERVLIDREIEKLKFNFGGITALTRPADVMVVVDPRHDKVAVREAQEMNIPIIAIMSSDCDATGITYPVIVNDSLQASVSLVLSELVKAIEIGKANYVPKPVAPRTADARARRTRRTA